ncbi:MAG: hypothetical protein IKJ01_10145, partial [Lachnospiraceae bacterium]|nr:hypothetical protein [Lachnospiraceae bacterium]
MENKEDVFAKIPFYMTYPMQNLYVTEMEYEKDMERMKQMYPKEVKQLQQMIDKRCDELEYEGSRIYDENPDKYMLEQEINRLYEEYLRQNPQGRIPYMPPSRPMSESQWGMEQRPPQPMPRPQERPDGQPQWDMSGRPQP